MLILNLGSGVKTSASPDVTNIDWSMYLRLRRNPVLRRLAPLLIQGERLERFRSLPDNIVVHDLATGVPFADGTVDAVYSSHMLEHLDRTVAGTFLTEIHRVLKPSGIVRIVVPDFERACRNYISHVALADHDPAEAAAHDDYVATILEQSVRREGYATRRQGPFRRRLDNKVLGDARRRGETHQWMYDRINLSTLLLSVGFRSPEVRDHLTSKIPDWDSYGLDLNPDGNEYRPGSLYVEALV